MQKIQFFSRKSIILLLAFTFIVSLANAQLKVGDNPTNIQKSSILELESTKQGLLLPRLTDTAGINALNPPDGMIIYLNADNSLRIRSGNAWKKLASMADAMANWSLTGNTGLDSAANFIGTLDGKPLTLKTNNQSRMIIGSNGNIGIGTTTPTAKLNVNGTVKLENLAAGTNELEVLVLANDGSVYKRSMSSSAFENAIKAINGIQKQTLSITAAASDTSNNVLVQNRASDSTIAIYLPVQDGSAGANKPYGFLTHGDWQKIQSAVHTITIGAVATTGNANGASLNFNADSTAIEIVLHAATATTAGIITAGTQTIGGDKTFAGNTTLNGTVTLGSVVNNTSADSVLVLNNGVVEKRKVSEAAFGNAIRSMNGNRDTAQTIAFTNTGTDLTISTANNNTINLNVPNASTTARGVVTTASQTFAGVKTFQDSVSAASAMKVGSTGNANSTMQVDGSLAMAIKTVTANYTATASDNTILADASSGNLTITLPAASGIAGRIYTVKKIGGGLDNDLIITPNGGTIDGGGDYKIYNNWTFVTLQTNGTNWFIIKK